MSKEVYLIDINLKDLSIDKAVEVSELAYDFCEGPEWERVKESRSIEKIWDFLEGNGASIKVTAIK